ncbi:SpvB/TcaC N-terminal domain-containing protein [Pseudomonas sp. NPDC088368]|uniref:SpvB/TcaC N-terminal domain-containing protein n=1 Tax=Pseudomonas sp. NPDC088368 TaxID=3364453 RepID=UPI003809E555
MADQEQYVSVSTPSLPKGGGAIQSIGKGWGAVGATGSASLDIPLPITAGRGHAPGLGLSYQSSVGNGLFGLGWHLNVGAISRRASKGVPLYTDEDVMLGPDGGVLLAQRDANGALLETDVSKYGGLTLDHTYQVVLYFARMEGAFARIEHWRHESDPAGFWLIHGADGTLAIYGRNPDSRLRDPANPAHVAEWLLEETMNPLGEHALYEYKAENLQGLVDETTPGPGRDFRAQRYLWRVRYGNFNAHPDLYLWQPQQLAELKWHFELVVDYGERTFANDTLAYAEDKPWEGRVDFHSSFSYGFELGNLRIAHYVLMFHHFPDELDADTPTLVSAQKFNYEDLQQGANVLASVESLAWGERIQPALSRRPPMVFSYQDFDVAEGTFSPFDAMPGLDDGQPYQLVDLYGESLSGVLYRSDKGWMYREPERDTDADDPDAVKYGPWRLLPNNPVADSTTTIRQSLADMTGDGRLDWVVAQPGMAGFFTLNPDRSWAQFTPFSAFPSEFFHPQGQLADLVGEGLSDLALIGPRSVRLYASQRASGFSKGDDIAHDTPDDALPLLSDSAAELVAFADMLGSGQQHLVRIRHNEVRVWANLGRGRFGKGQVFATLPFAYDEFDAGSVRLADMDGSGAVDFVYLRSDGFQLFMNQSGNRFAEPVTQPWPDGVRYDHLCQVRMADLQGVGCSSLVLTVPHMQTKHWRYDHPPIKPYLLQGSRNGMGASGTVEYRSSAQEWLDEKNELREAGLAVESGVPFALHVVIRQTQRDEVTGNELSQRFRFRQGYYDGHEREFRGFGLVCQTDSETSQVAQQEEGFTAPVLTKTWYHSGRYPVRTPTGFDESDKDAVVLGNDLLTSFTNGIDQIIPSPSDDDLREMARSLAGALLRVEVFGLESDAPHAVPYSVQTSRYLVRQLAPVSEHQPYARQVSLLLESISYQYEGRADDPMCQRVINLKWDQYGVLTHGAGVNYGRRRSAGDPPPFEDEHQQRWWQAAHDEAQQNFYLTETRAQPIHLDAAHTWRLGLPYLSRANAMVAETSSVSADDISYERFSDETGWFASLPRTLVSLSKQCYVNAGEGEAGFQALTDAVELAELDDHALTAYDRVMTPDELTAKLIELRYHKMACFLPDEPSRTLWSVKRGFNTYADGEHFYRVEAFKPTASHGLTTVEYDPYSLMVKTVTAPDGCVTSATYSYHAMQPVKIVDPNRNSQEALYDGFGVPRMTSFYGTELGEAVGFQSLVDIVLEDAKPAAAIEHPSSIDFATVHYYDAFSWANDHVPVHSLAMQWDRYPNDPERQLRMTLASVDGFGRALQTRQLVEPGKAYQVVDAQLSVGDDGQLIEVDADPRWRVSERVEYNNKGLAVRVYRPYFTNTQGYVDDGSVRAHWYHDKQFYDPLGRPTVTLTARGWMRRITYEGWYTINEDENDTAEEVNLRRAEQGLPLLDDGSPRKRKNPFQR